MSPRSRLPVLLIAAASMVCVAAVPAPVIYPAKGQSASKQTKDRQHCNTWAINQTGFDPAVAPPPPQKSGGILKGGGLGALGGAAIGSFSGNAGKGAAIGALAGGTVGGVREHNQNQSTQAQYDQHMESYNRALGACMTGRGYTVR